MVETKTEKKEVKNKLYEFFNDKNSATRKELTEYMEDLWEGEKEQRNINNMIGKILNEGARDGKFTKERKGNQLVFTLGEGIFVEEDEEEEEEAEEEAEEEETEKAEDKEADKEEDEDEAEDEEEEEVEEEVEEDEETEKEEAEDEVEAEEEEVDEDEEKAMAKYKEETGKNALTTTNTIRKDYLKWKKANWE